jgi:peptidyl-prolyl cis-trans isomerase C
MPRFLQLTAALLIAIATAGSASAQSARDIEADAVAAKVGETEITMGEVQSAYRALPRQYRQQGFGQVYPILLERMVQQEVLMQRGREAGLADDPEVKRRVDELRDQVIHDVYLSRKVEEAITEEALRTEYDRFLKQNPPREEVKARHILVDEKAVAENLIQQVTDGADFATLAKEHSKGPSGERGGDLGWFPRGQMVGPFEEAAFGLQPNQFTAEPIETQFGWHVILVEDKRSVPAPSFEEVRPRLLENLGQEVAFKIADDMVESSAVQRYGLDGEPMSKPAVGGAQQ